MQLGLLNYLFRKTLWTRWCVSCFFKIVKHWISCWISRSWYCYPRSIWSHRTNAPSWPSSLITQYVVFFFSHFLQWFSLVVLKPMNHIYICPSLMYLLKYHLQRTVAIIIQSANKQSIVLHTTVSWQTLLKIKIMHELINCTTSVHSDT